VKYQVAQLFNSIKQLPNNQGASLISPSFLLRFRQGIISILYAGQNLGVVQNVALYENLVTVVQDSINPNQVDATVPSQMIAQLNGASINILVFSSLYNFSNTVA
jgi:phage tail sheath gpL-like